MKEPSLEEKKFPDWDVGCILRSATAVLEWIGERSAGMLTFTSREKQRKGTEKIPALGKRRALPRECCRIPALKQ
ncbi:hypothetical protein KIL84_006773 [Mauremys mutica]|uniref:Uncharacterized protein n=1 Tax=Mauremys mutica TaxID=74926 RepID=A0A9D3X242_9SAUR|nr:hypothetical protein KIL84_006773 [Mauremys mutica]